MMMKRSISLVTALCLLSLCACAAPGGRAVSPASADGEMGSSVSFTDSLGSTITLEEAPQRVAALIGSYAETWVLAGGEDTLAAVTHDAYDERGLELGEDVTNVGSNQTPELEALFAAQPDLVLLTPDLDGQLALAEPLAAAGIPAAWFKVESFSDYLSMLEICTRLTGRDDLYQANGLDIQAEIDRVLARVPEGEHPTVLLLRAYSTRGLLRIDFHPAWLALNLVLVLAEIWCLMNLSAWVLPVVALTAVICIINVREVYSLVQKLLGRFLRRKGA